MKTLWEVEIISREERLYSIIKSKKRAAAENIFDEEVEDQCPRFHIRRHRKKNEENDQDMLELDNLKLKMGKCYLLQKSVKRYVEAIVKVKSDETMEVK